MRLEWDVATRLSQTAKDGAMSGSESRFEESGASDRLPGAFLIEADFYHLAQLSISDNLLVPSGGHVRLIE
jgi:hypothetical protein